MKSSAQFQIPRYLGLKSVHPTKRGQYEVVLGYSKDRQKNLTVDTDGLSVLMELLSSTTLAQLARNTGISKKEIRQLVSSLKADRIVEEVRVVPKELKRYDRHLLYYHLAEADALAVQRAVGKTRVALIGMGGIGNWVSAGLIGAGLKEIRLIDFDRVELTNLTRQMLFAEKDIGKLKTQIAARILRPKNRQTRISTVHVKLDSASSLRKHLKGIDFVVLSADKPEQIHDWVDEACFARSIPYLNIGYRDGNGVVGPLTIPRETSCYQCFKPRPGEGPKAKAARPSAVHAKFREKFDARYQAPSFGPLNALVSAIGVNELLKHAGGFGEPTSADCEISVDPLSLTLQHHSYSRDPKCWHCGSKAKRK